MAINTSGQSVSIATDGNLLVMIAPASVLTSGKVLTDLKTTDLSAAAFVDVTYDLTAGSGWAEATSQENVTDDRLTSRTTFSKPGKVTNTLTIQYVYGDTTSVVDPLIVEGQYYIAAVRWATPHDKAIAASDKFDLWYLQAGTEQKDAAAANGLFTKTQQLYPQRFQPVRDYAVSAS